MNAPTNAINGGPFEGLSAACYLSRWSGGLAD